MKGFLPKEVAEIYVRMVSMPEPCDPDATEHLLAETDDRNGGKRLICSCQLARKEQAPVRKPPIHTVRRFEKDHPTFGGVPFFFRPSSGTDQNLMERAAEG